MTYLLKKRNDALLAFDVDYEDGQANVQILSVNMEKIPMMPPGLELSNEGLMAWIHKRSIPQSRAFMQDLMKLINVAPNDPAGIITTTKGLSLNDDYWVVPFAFDGTFEDFNLYDNKLDQVVSLTAFTGYGSRRVPAFTNSPEFSTGGNLRKCWRRRADGIYLYKGGSGDSRFKASNEGYEPYSEYLAGQLAAAMGIPHVQYDLEIWKNELCSTCKLFTSKEISYAPVSAFIGYPSLADVLAFYRKLGKEYENAFVDMLLLDALILNKDRHYNNFGLLLDAASNTITAPAPVFDNGQSLLHSLAPDYWNSFETVLEAAGTIVPKAFSTPYDADYIQFLLPLMRADHKKMLLKLRRFSFRQHPVCPLPENRLHALSRLIRRRAEYLLERMDSQNEK